MQPPFAKKVLSLREGEGFTQTQAAEAWGVNLRTLQAWEAGRNEPNPFIGKCVLFFLRWRNRVPVEKPASAKKGQR